MKWLIKTYSAMIADRRGVTALEYGLIASVIASVTAIAFKGLGTHSQTMLNTVNTAL